MKSLLVLGGGLTGLSCAYFASRAGYNVTVLEASDKLGGLLDTFEIGGNRLEKYYHHFFTHDTELLWLLRELELSDKLVFHDSTMGIYSHGRIYDFNGPVDLLKMGCLNLDDKIRFGLTSLYLSKLADWKKNENIPVYRWFLKYAGKSVTEIIWEPLLKSKFGSYYDQIPLSWMIGRLSQRVGSRKGVKEQLGYLEGSTDVLLKALIDKLEKQGVKLSTGKKVIRLITDGKKVTGVETQYGNYSADEIISTLPANILSRLIQKLDPEYAKKLAEIEYFGAICLIYELSGPLSKIYWLNVAEKNFSFGGVIEHTNLIPSENYSGSHIIYLSRYFGRQEEIGRLDGSQIEMIMSADLNKIYPGFNPSMIKNTYFYKTDTAATVCNLNFSNRVPECKTPIENLFNVSMAHIYPDERSCNNSIRTAAKACKVMGIDTSYVPTGRSLSGLIGMD
jgi:protoporphyrinogen oxidase